jgi:hypothetical protein
MELINAKKNVILVDERAHGLSEGHTLTYGKKEQYDVLSWVDYLKKEFGEDIKITLIGISMGATAILGVADKLDKNIKIIADSPYISLKNVLKIALSKVYNNHFFGYPLIAFACLLYCRMSTKYEITENIHNSKNKILIIYGTADHLVPYSVIEGVFLQNKNHVTLEVFDGVGHGIGYNRAPERYLKVMFDFINN